MIIVSALWYVILKFCPLIFWKYKLIRLWKELDMKELNWISYLVHWLTRKKPDRIKSLTKRINVSEFNWPQPISRSIIPTGRAYCSTLDFRSDEPFLGNVTNSRRVVRFLPRTKKFHHEIKKNLEWNSHHRPPIWMSHWRWVLNQLSATKNTVKS